MNFLDLNQKILSAREVSDFIFNNEKKYYETQKPIKCLSRLLPCMCFHRNIECLFLDVFEKLQEEHTHIIDEKYLDNELRNFETIKHKNEEVEIWLKRNLEIGFSKLGWFPNAPKYQNLRLSFINGKNRGKFDYLSFEIDGKDLKNNYNFAHLFCDLFFNQVILPNELAKWKYENEDLL